MATKKPSDSSSSSSLPALLQKTLSQGVAVRLTTTLDEVVQGHVFTHDIASNLIILELEASSNSGKDRDKEVKDYAVYNSSAIKSAELLTTTPLSPCIPPKLEMDKLRVKEARNTEERTQALKKIGMKTTPDGQRLFDALSSLYTSCAWKESDIVIFDNVIIPPPYTTARPAENQGTSKQLTDAIKRVQMSVDTQRSKLGLK